MNATKILWGQILLVSLVVLVFVWTATEWTAWRLGFQPQLGSPWFALLPFCTASIPSPCVLTEMTSALIEAA